MELTTTCNAIHQATSYIPNLLLATLIVSIGLLAISAGRRS